MGFRKKKHWAVCNNIDNPLPHTCHKNWDDSSSAIESDIIVEGFLQYVQQYREKYNMCIGDGDSSVQSNLVSNIPWGFAIEKVE